jgi:hypothetical protein
VAGAAVSYSFTATSPTLGIELKEAADWVDNNPTIAAVTLERL